MRYYRPRRARGIRFAEDLQELKNFARFGVNAHVQKLDSILRYDNRPFTSLERYVRENPNDSRAKDALVLWKQALSLCDEAAGRCKQAEGLLKRR